MNILFIEDHPHKLNLVVNYLSERFPASVVETRGSYNSGLKELILNNSKYDVLLLDISMPNYDISPQENGGDFLPFAGKLILKEMYLREIPTKAIVITMHSSFEDGTRLPELLQTLSHEFEENYLGHVYFTFSNSEWQHQLEKLIKKFDI